MAWINTQLPETTQSAMSSLLRLLSQSLLFLPAQVQHTAVLVRKEGQNVDRNFLWIALLTFFLLYWDVQGLSLLSSCAECHLFINRWPVNWISLWLSRYFSCPLPCTQFCFGIVSSPWKRKKRLKVVWISSGQTVDWSMFFSYFAKEKSEKLYFSPNVQIVIVA